jgi:hypothetical protein
MDKEKKFFENDLYSIEITEKTYSEVLSIVENEDTLNKIFEPKIKRYVNKVYLIFYY